MVSLCSTSFNNSRQSNLFSVPVNQTQWFHGRSTADRVIVMPPWYVGYGVTKRRGKALRKRSNRQEMSKNFTDAMKWHLALCGPVGIFQEVIYRATISHAFENKSQSPVGLITTSVRSEVLVLHPAECCSDVIFVVASGELSQIAICR